MNFIKGWGTSPNPSSIAATGNIEKTTTANDVVGVVKAVKPALDNNEKRSMVDDGEPSLSGMEGVKIFGEPNKGEGLVLKKGSVVGAGVSGL
eukprot:CAMPEP_0184669282 /NCGR_PEP_ID=MMETSP0308-20130426/76517_1 /TAXON_ID=38269 /ORGANISM="Gloeochaete witrockiana, Strain SAG 46.84" /LENGTH=91 /DNA_ID=CAMNT_0027115461 /DNA_START=286 /DNA_END=557 /DNA_ORIENTATION=-